MTKEKCMTVVVDKDVPDVRYSVEIKDKEETESKKKSEINAIILMMNPASSYYEVEENHKIEKEYYSIKHTVYDDEGNKLSNDCIEKLKNKQDKLRKKEKRELEYSKGLDDTTKKILKLNDKSKIYIKNFILVNVSPFVQTNTQKPVDNKKIFLDRIMEKEIVNENEDTDEYKKVVNQRNKEYISMIINNHSNAKVIIATGEMPYKMSQYYFDIISSIDSNRLYGFADDKGQHLSLTKTGYTRHPRYTSVNNGIKEFNDKNYNESMHHLFEKQDKKDKS